MKKRVIAIVCSILFFATVLAVAAFATTAYTPSVSANAAYEVWFRIGCENALIGNTKTNISSIDTYDTATLAPYEENGKVYMPLAALTKQFAYKGKMYTLSDNTVKIQAGLLSSKKLTVDGSSVVKKNGAVYVTYDAVKKDAFDSALYYFYDPELQSIVVSSKSGSVSNFSLDNYATQATEGLMLAKFICESTTADSLLADISAAGTDLSAHPRILVGGKRFEELGRIFRGENLTENEVYLQASIGSIKTSVDYILNSEFNSDGTALAGSGLTYYNEKYGGDYDAGGRNNEIASHGKRLQQIGFIYAVTGEQKYANAFYTLTKRLSEWKQWGDGHFLNCADAGSYISLGFDWCYNGLTPSQRTEIEDILFDKVVAMGYLSITYDGSTCPTNKTIGNLGTYSMHHSTRASGGWKITNRTNNWNTVCAAGLTVSSLAIMEREEYRPYCAAVISGMLNRVPNCFAQYLGGAYSEGPTYWVYGTGTMMLMLKALKNSTGKVYGMTEASGLEESFYFANYIRDSQYKSWSFHDAYDSLLDLSSFYIAAELFENPDFALYRNQMLFGGGVNADMTDLLLYSPSLSAGASSMDLDAYMKGVDTVTMRSSWDYANDPNRIFAGLHAGPNNSTHSDADSGNVYLKMGGVLWLADFGQDSNGYNGSDYFGVTDSSTKWHYYYKTVESHSTVVLRGCSALPYGQKLTAAGESYAKIIGFETNEYGALAVADMTPSFAGSPCTSAKRALLLTDSRNRVVLRDEMQFSSATDLTWIAALNKEMDASSAVIAPDGKTAFLYYSGKLLRVTLLSDDATLGFSLKSDAIFPTTNDGKTAITPSGNITTRLVIEANKKTSFNVSVVFELIASADAPATNYTAVSISSMHPVAGMVSPAFILTRGGNTYVGYDAEGGLAEKQNAKTVFEANDLLTEMHFAKAGDIFTLQKNVTVGGYIPNSSVGWQVYSGNITLDLAGYNLTAKDLYTDDNDNSASGKWNVLFYNYNRGMTVTVRGEGKIFLEDTGFMQWDKADSNTAGGVILENGVMLERTSNIHGTPLCLLRGGSLKMEDVTVREHTPGEGGMIVIASPATASHENNAVNILLSNCNITAENAKANSASLFHLGSSVPPTIGAEGCTFYLNDTENSYVLGGPSGFAIGNITFTSCEFRLGGGFSSAQSAGEVNVILSSLSGGSCLSCGNTGVQIIGCLLTDVGDIGTSAKLGAYASTSGAISTRYDKAYAHISLADGMVKASNTGADAATHPYAVNFASRAIRMTADGKSVSYSTFAQAISAAQAKDTVILLADDTISASVTVNADLKILLGGFKLTSTATGSLFSVSASASLKIYDGEIETENGLVNVTSSGAVKIEIKNVNLKQTKASDSTYIFRDNGTAAVEITVSDCTFRHAGTLFAQTKVTGVLTVKATDSMFLSLAQGSGATGRLVYTASSSYPVNMTFTRCHIRYGNGTTSSQIAAYASHKYTFNDCVVSVVTDGGWLVPKAAEQQIRVNGGWYDIRNASGSALPITASTNYKNGVVLAQRLFLSSWSQTSQTVDASASVTTGAYVLAASTPAEMYRIFTVSTYYGKYALVFLTNDIDITQNNVKAVSQSGNFYLDLAGFTLTGTDLPSSVSCSLLKNNSANVTVTGHGKIVLNNSVLSYTFTNFSVIGDERKIEIVKNDSHNAEPWEMIDIRSGNLTMKNVIASEIGIVGNGFVRAHCGGANNTSTINVNITDCEFRSASSSTGTGKSLFKSGGGANSAATVNYHFTNCVIEAKGAAFNPLDIFRTNIELTGCTVKTKYFVYLVSLTYERNITLRDSSLVFGDATTSTALILGAKQNYTFIDSTVTANTGDSVFIERGTEETGFGTVIIRGGYYDFSSGCIAKGAVAYSAAKGYGILIDDRSCFTSLGASTALFPYATENGCFFCYNGGENAARYPYAVASSANAYGKVVLTGDREETILVKWGEMPKLSGGQQGLYTYRLSPDPTPVNCLETHYTVSEDRDFTVYANLTLYADIDLNLYIDTAVIGGAESVRFDGGKADFVKFDDRYSVLKIQSIRIPDIGKVYTLEITVHGQTYVFEVSGESYAKLMLGSEKISREEKQAITDLLAYAKEAGATVTADLSGRSTGTSVAPAEGIPSAYVTSASFVIGTGTGFRFTVANGVTGTVRFSIANNAGENLYLEAKAGETVTMNVRAYNLNNTVTVYHDGVKVGAYNIGNYLASSAGQSVAPIVKAMENYANSAELLRKKK